VRIEILPEAREDLISGYRFYEGQAPGLGTYFRDSLLEDVDRLGTNAGTHAKVFGYHRSLSKRFPFAIYSRVESDVVRFAQSWSVAEIRPGSAVESAGLTRVNDRHLPVTPAPAPLQVQ
jgi:hypothetical protein